MIDYLELNESDFEQPQLEVELKMIRECLKKLKTIDKEMLILYLHDKVKVRNRRTYGRTPISKRTLRNILFHQERFFKENGLFLEASNE